jgi:citrate lyase subunit beta/citryl-CoA lyase
MPIAASARRLHRSLLFAPASRAELMDKAARSTADSLIYDLEDSVAPSAKDAARVNLTQALAAGGPLPVYVRVHHFAAGDTQADLLAIAAAGAAPSLAGVVLPKAQRASDVEELSKRLAEVERTTGRAEGTLQIVPMVEDCLGLRNAYELASASPRVSGIVLASAEQGDFILDLGGRWTPQSLALAYPRSRLVCEARAAGLEWIVDGVFMNLKDGEALRRESLIARELGMVGKMAIHPTQLGPIHDVFSPSEQEVEDARSLVEAYEEARAAGRGAITHKGMMVDEANLKLARKVLGLAGAQR